MSAKALSIVITIIAISPTAADDTAMIAKAQSSLASKLHDPESARFSDLRVVAADGRQIVCGRVNAKNRMGGYDGAKPFLWDPKISAGAIVYGGQAITDDPISNLAQVKGYRDSCGP